MSEGLYQKPSMALTQRRSALAPEIDAAFKSFSTVVFQERALSRKTKQLIAIAVAHVTQCPYCILGHAKAAIREGATPEEIMEAIWVAAEMRAGAAFAHSVLALGALDAPVSQGTA
jgi:AhpD family alkylhydroperoxidase